MVDSWDDFRRFEEMMNRMFEEFWGRPGRRFLPSGRLLPPGERERLCRLNTGSLPLILWRRIRK